MAIVAMSLLVACSSPEATAPSPTTSTIPPTTTQTVQSLAERCGVADAGQPRMIESSTGERLYAVGAGTGKQGVVLVHGSGSRGICNWANEIAWLARSGLHVTGYDQACVGDSTCAGETRPVDDLIAVVADLRRRGATEVAVIGASAGGALPLVAAGRPQSGISSVVSLSAVLREPVGDAEPTKIIADVKAPVLYVLAADDPASSPAEVRSFQRRTRGSRLVLLPAGSGHAQDVLYDSRDSRGSRPSSFRTTLLDFVRS